MEHTTNNQEETPHALQRALSAVGRPPSWRELGEGWKRISDALRGWGFLAAIPIGFAGAGWFALLAMADGLATSPWDHASPQDLVWLGMRMPMLGSMLAMTLWTALAFAGWTRTQLAAVDEAVEAYLSAHEGTFAAKFRSFFLRWYLFFAKFLPYLAVAAAFIKVLAEPLVHAAEVEMKSALRLRPQLVRMAGTDQLESVKLRGRLGDYYVFVDDHGPKLVARSQVLELRAGEAELE
jgi:hypothetical protein